MNRRVVITGIGLVSSLGIGTAANWAALVAGRSGVTRITRFDVSAYAAQIAAEVKDFDPLNWIEKKDIKKMDLFIQYAIAASQFAMDDAKLAITADNAADVGVFIGSGIGGFITIEREHEALLKGGPRKVSPFFIPSAIINLASGQVSIRFGAKGPNLATCTACSASAHAVGESYEIIKRGDADAMIAGGSEAAITPMSVGGFGQLRALSTRNDEPERASRPFDKDRDGFIIGEGAGVLVIEALEHARARGARIYAELAGYGTSCDAGHLTDPDATGAGPARAMAIALADAGVEASAVGYVNAHATSTTAGDIAESRALLRAGLGAAAVSSTKSAHGHALGAAGGVEAVATLMAFARDTLPATLNLEDPDPESPLDHVREPRAARVQVAVSNSFGFGGHNACLVLTRHDDPV
jgi:3-oxoacyl-[acyl-carrier-protein] synthase II